MSELCDVTANITAFKLPEREFEVETQLPVGVSSTLDCPGIEGCLAMRKNVIAAIEADWGPVDKRTAALNADLITCPLIQSALRKRNNNNN